jgi:hypothetical protein
MLRSGAQVAAKQGGRPGDEVWSRHNVAGSCSGLVRGHSSEGANGLTRA